MTAFVVSLNLKRRHLTAMQKAAVAVDMLPSLEEEAKARQQEKEKWILDARKQVHPVKGEPCKVCNGYAYFTQAHHIIPLSEQFDMAFIIPSHEIVYLCPTHHVILHQWLTAFKAMAKDINAKQPECFETLPKEEANALINIAMPYYAIAVKHYRRRGDL